MSFKRTESPDLAQELTDRISDRIQATGHVPWKRMGLFQMHPAASPRQPREDKREIFHATADGQKIADWLLNLHPISPGTDRTDFRTAAAVAQQRPEVLPCARELSSHYANNLYLRDSEQP